MQQKFRLGSIGCPYKSDDELDAEVPERRVGDA